MEPGILGRLGDDELLGVGVPTVLLPAVRAVKTRTELEALVRHMPEEAAEALTWLGEGMPLDEVRVLLEATQAKKAVDTLNMAEALEHPDTKRRFAKIETQHDLAGMLNAPLAKWRVFLHPSQERLVTQSFNGPARALGGAGTGKTVVAMHRARHLARDVFREKTDRVLFTTFTENLARTVESQLKTLCEDEIERIEIVHLHAWAVRFMKAQGVEFSIADDETIRDCWSEAAAVTKDADWEEGFLRQEWEQVVQAGGITARQDYLRVSRVGRGKTLTRAQRDKIWNVFEEFRGALRRLKKVEWLDVVRETREYLEKAKGALLPYRAVVVDEAQDLHQEEWRLIRALVPAGANDLFLVGDAHQRIYARKVVLSRCGIDIRGRSRKLRINYRTTRQIKQWAEAILTGIPYDDLDGGADDLKGYTSLLTGPAPDVTVFPTLEVEQEFLASALRVLSKEFHPEEICLVARTATLRNKYAAALAKAKLSHVVLDQDAHEKDEGIRVATMHRVKGLEFRCMILAGINSGTMPLRLQSLEGDATAQQEHDARERSLLFVAATRARDRLVVTCWGEASGYLAGTSTGPCGTSGR